MKTTNQIGIALVLLASSLSSCMNLMFNQEKVHGNGHISNSIVNTDDYDKISVSGSMKVTLIEGSEGDISIETDENIIDLIEVYVKNDKLHIGIQDGYSIDTDHGVKLTVPVESVDQVSLSGSGDVIAKTELKSKSMEVELAGSGDIKLWVDARTIEADIAGSGDIHLKGACKDLEVSIAGSGDFHGLQLMSEDVYVSIAGSGDAKVNCSDKLDVDVAGSGDVKYVGMPEISKSIAGSGTVQSLE